MTLLFTGAIFDVTKNGRPLIILDGNRFNFHTSSRGPRGFFVCSRWANGCRASIKTHNKEIILVKKDHTH